MFLEEISVWISSRLSKADCPLQCWWTSFNNLLRSWIEHKSRGKRVSFCLTFALHELKHQSSPDLRLGLASELLFLKLLNLSKNSHYQFSWFSSYWFFFFFLENSDYYSFHFDAITLWGQAGEDSFIQGSFEGNYYGLTVCSPTLNLYVEILTFHVHLEMGPLGCK